MFETKHQQGLDIELASPATATFINLFNRGTIPDFCDSQPGVPIQTGPRRMDSGGNRKLDRDEPDEGHPRSAGPVGEDVRSASRVGED